MNRDAQGRRVVRLRTLLALGGLLIGVLGGIGIWQWPLLRDQPRGWMFGQLELAAEKYGYMLAYTHSVDTIEISEVENGPRATNSIALVVGSRTLHVKCGPTRQLAGAEAEEFLKRWSWMHFHYNLSGMCHDEAFAIRFRKNDKSALETTICFKCQNFEIPFPFTAEPVYMGFDLGSPASQAFLAEVRRLFPDSPKWVEMDKQREGREKKRSSASGTEASKLPVSK